MTDTENKKSATERLTDLETAMTQVVQIIQPFEMFARDLHATKETLKLLNNKLDSLIKALNTSNGGAITDELLSKYMIENNVKELTDKVAKMVTDGVLAASDAVTSESFVVINEVSPNGDVVNPRMQFLVSALQHEEVRTKLTGSKVGDNLKVGDQGASINVLESYNVVTPQAQEQVAQTAPADTAAPAEAEQTPAADPTPAATG